MAQLAKHSPVSSHSHASTYSTARIAEQVSMNMILRQRTEPNRVKVLYPDLDMNIKENRSTTSASRLT